MKYMGGKALHRVFHSEFSDPSRIPTPWMEDAKVDDITGIKIHFDIVMPDAEIDKLPDANDGYKDFQFG